MGYIKHNAIIVTGWRKEEMQKAREKAMELNNYYFSTSPTNSMISEMVEGIANEQYSFFIAPDGSKEGWASSDSGDKFRKDFCDWLCNEQDIYCDYIEVRFGGDDDSETIIRSKDSDLKKEDPYAN